jgi:hypothetical protein
MTTVISRERRVSLLIAAGLVLLATATAGCSGQGSAAQLDENSPIGITTRATFITVENRAGMPLDNIKLTVVPYGNVPFMKSLPRIENAATREVALNELSSQDGTTFNPRLSKPKLIRLSATDSLGKRYDIEMPWQ